MSLGSAPLLPCWYCNGISGDGEPFNPAVHKGWGCEACDERRALRTAGDALAEALRLSLSFRLEGADLEDLQKRTGSVFAAWEAAKKGTP